jgi:hypothetical protein
MNRRATPPPQTLADVATLPPRTAHVVYALIVAVDDLKMPVKTDEVLLYDGESNGVRSTGSALRDACRLGLAQRVPIGGYWIPTPKARELWIALEDRYLEDTEPLWQ